MKKLIGEVSVDSGTLWIGDPCYVIHKEKTDNRLGQNWEEFSDKLIKNDFNPTNFDYLGITVGTMFGDGIYAVYGNYDSSGNLTSVTVKLV